MGLRHAEKEYMKSVVFAKSSFNLLQSLSYNNEIYSEIADPPPPPPIQSRHPSEGPLSLCGKRFRASSSRKLGRQQKKGNDGGGGGERRKRLPANPTILKNCVCPRTQLLIGAVLVVLIT